MLIRKATPEDLSSIRSLEQQAETAAHWNSREYEVLFSPEVPRRIVLVAAEAEDLLLHGFVIARCGIDEWEIENVVVAEQQRRHGIGAALVGQVLEQARDSGVTSVLLEVRQSNAAARRLYEKLGFTEVGRRPDYYREPPEDALLLKISISVP